jgi:hypothetical protein
VLARLKSPGSLPRRAIVPKLTDVLASLVTVKVSVAVWPDGIVPKSYEDGVRVTFGEVLLAASYVAGALTTPLWPRSATARPIAPIPVPTTRSARPSRS